MSRRVWYSLWPDDMKPMTQCAKAVKHWLLTAAGLVTMPMVVLMAALRLFTRYRSLQEAEVVIVMSDAGFGHTITGADVARRLFRGHRCVFICLSRFGRHNWRVAELWPDIHVIFLPFTVGIRMGHQRVGFVCPKWFRRVLAAFALGVARLISGFRVEGLTLPQLYERLSVSEQVDTRLERFPGSFQWGAFYFRLQREIDAPSVRLPSVIGQRIRRRLDEVVRPPLQVGRWLCCLYLRQKGVEEGDMTSRRRCGSPFSDYLPALRLLTHANYQVLVTGDVALGTLLPEDLCGLVVDAGSLGVDKELFDLYAATEADLFIGEPGGGVWLPGINGVPRLLVNAFPYFFGLPKAWMHYKVVRDATGCLVPYRRLFEQYACDYELKGMTVHNNTAAELREAVACFLEDLAHPTHEHLSQGIVSTLPNDLWVAQADARLSRAWLKLYDEEAVDRPDVEPKTAAGDGQTVIPRRLEG